MWGISHRVLACISVFFRVGAALNEGFGAFHPSSLSLTSIKGSHYALLSYLLFSIIQNWLFVTTVFVLEQSKSPGWKKSHWIFTILMGVWFPPPHQIRVSLVHLDEDTASTVSVNQLWILSEICSFRGWAVVVLQINVTFQVMLEAAKEVWHFSLISLTQSSFKLWMYFISYSVYCLAGSFQVYLFSLQVLLVGWSNNYQCKWAFVGFVQIFLLHRWSVPETSNREE